MEETLDDGSKKPRVRYSFVFSLMLLVYTAILVAVAFPYAKENFQRFNLKEHYELFLSEREGIKSDPLPLVFYSSNGPVKVSKEIVMHGEDELHLILEALLLGPNSTELGLGYVSYIPEDTKLIGASEINGIVFADFSEEIKDSSYLSAALNQIKETLISTGKYWDVHVLSEGEEIEDLV